MSAPAVSVVVIFLNEERFLGEAVSSVLAQTFGDWELLLCDDGSTDGSRALAQRWAADHAKIRYLDHPDHANQGMSATRNLGIAAARGRYVALLDADDVWLPTKLAEQVPILDDNPAVGMVAGASQYWQSWDGGSDWVVPVGATQDVVVEPPGLATTLYPLGKGAAPCPSDLLLRRDMAQVVGGFEESFRGALQLYEDQAFLAKVYLRYPVWISGSCLSRYRQRADSCVATVTAEGEYLRVRRHFLDYLQEHLDSSGNHDPRVRAALRKAGRSRPYWLRSTSLPHRVVRRLGRILARASRQARRMLPDRREHSS